MKKNNRQLEEQILLELKDVPDEKLQKILEILRYLKVGLKTFQGGESISPEMDVEKLLESGSGHISEKEKKSERTPYFRIQQTAE